MIGAVDTRLHDVARRARSFNHWAGLGGLLIAILLLIINVLLVPSFWSISSLGGLGSTYVPIACAAMGVSFAMLAGGIDLSIGGVVCLVNVVTVGFVGAGTHFFTAGPAGQLYVCTNLTPCTGGWPFWAAALVGLFAGTLIGVLNGFAIGILRIHPLLATLATGFVASGLALYYFPEPGGAIPTSVVSWYTGNFLGIPMPFWLLIIVAIGALFVLISGIGLRQRASGTDPWKAFVSGVAVGRSRFGAYVLASFFCSIGGVLLTMNIASADPTSGSDYTLTAIAAAVLGGVSLAGGWSDPIGPIFGTFLLGLVSNIVLSTNIPSYFDIFASGAVVIVGLAATSLIRNRSFGQLRAIFHRAKVKAS